MPGSIMNGGAWKLVKGLHVMNGAAWKKAKSGWVMSGGVWKKFYSSFSVEFMGVWEQATAGLDNSSTMNIGPADADRTIYLFTGTDGNPGQVATVTVNGGAVTQLARLGDSNAAAGMYAVAVPAGTTATIRLLWSFSNAVRFIVGLWSVYGTHVPEVLSTLNGSALTFPAIKAGDAIIAGLADNTDLAGVNWVGLTNAYEQAFTTSSDFSLAHNLSASADSVNYFIDNAATTDSAMVAVRLRPTVPADYRYVRWNVTANRGDSNTQASEFRLFDQVGTNVLAGVIPYYYVGGTPAAGESHDKLTDSATTTKLCALGTTSWDIAWDLGTAKRFNTYSYATANDVAARDPLNWTVQGSNDGSNWTVLHTVAGTSVTTTRQATLGPFAFTPIYA